MPVSIIVVNPPRGPNSRPDGSLGPPQLIPVPGENDDGPIISPIHFPSATERERMRNPVFNPPADYIVRNPGYIPPQPLPGGGYSPPVFTPPNLGPVYNPPGDYPPSFGILPNEQQAFPQAPGNTGPGGVGFNPAVDNSGQGTIFIDDPNDLHLYYPVAGLPGIVQIGDTPYYHPGPRHPRPSLLFIVPIDFTPALPPRIMPPWVLVPVLPDPIPPQVPALPAVPGKGGGTGGGGNAGGGDMFTAGNYVGTLTANTNIAGLTPAPCNFLIDDGGVVSFSQPGTATVALVGGALTAVVVGLGDYAGNTYTFHGTVSEDLRTFTGTWTSTGTVGSGTWVSVTKQ